DRGPLIVEDPDLVSAQVDHRFDGEGHPGLQSLAAAPAPVVFDLGLLVELAPDAMADEIADHGAAVLMRKVLNGRADISQPGSGFDLRDAERQATAGDLGHPLGVRAGGPDIEGGGG